jgi:hypothetical protein
VRRLNSLEEWGKSVKSLDLVPNNHCSTILFSGYKLSMMHRYCPSVCTLKPGQMIHINKGRLHAFRKLSHRQLPGDDCHAMQRAHVVDKENIRKEELCISIAWDWMYRGITESGIRREVGAAITCASLNQKNGVRSLGIPEAALLHMARSLCNNGRNEDGPYQPASEVICRGILQGLSAIVEEHGTAMACARRNVRSDEAAGNDDSFTVLDKSDADQNPLTGMINAYGSTDYTCRVCSRELSNIYCHCNGCENLMGKDFNICVGCHSEKNYKSDVTMGSCKVMHSGHHHTGSFKGDSRCDCVESPESGYCLRCGKCATCTCNCHSNFSLHFRFFDEEAEQRLVKRVEALGTKPENYVEKYLAGKISKRCSLFPFCLEDSYFCGGFKHGSCWCFKDRLEVLPTKDEIKAERLKFDETKSGKELIENKRKRNADLRREGRNKNKIK